MAKNMNANAELAKCRLTMYIHLRLEGDELFNARGWCITGVCLCIYKRVWELFPNDVAPPSGRGEKVWGALIGQTIAIDGLSCSLGQKGLSRAHLLGTLMHKVMQAAAFSDRNRAQKRAFDAVCDVGVYCALDDFDTKGDADEEAALAEQRRLAVASVASVSACEFANALRAAYGRSGIMKHGDAKMLQWYRHICYLARNGRIV